MKAALVLEDSRAFVGRSFGATSDAGGEVCFNTGMTGYQEVLTDPSYRGQIVCMTYPLIGNYGVNAADAESRGVHPRGFVVKEVSPAPSDREPASVGLNVSAVIGWPRSKLAADWSCRPWSELLMNSRPFHVSE